MSNILKKPYEISLWDDILTFVDINGKESEGEIASNLTTIAAQYYKEKKLCIIGSNTMEAPIRAVKPKLVSKVNGENTLTFTVYSHYWDEDAQKLQWNPFMMYLTNERKVKLKYGGKWYDFVIKNISEDSSTKAFTYTCKDLFVNELSKTGFELEFDNELGNNMGNLPTLAGRILEGSDWQLKPNTTNTVKQYLEEPLYRMVFQKDNYLPEGLKIKCTYGPDGYDKEVPFPYGKEIYVFYSSIQNESTRLEFLYDSTGRYLTDDKNVILSYEDDTVRGISNYYLENVEWTKPDSWKEGDTKNLKIAIKSGEDTIIYSLEKEFLEFVPTKRGSRLIRSQKTYFDPKLKRTVNVYNEGNVYGYKTTDYISPITVQSYVTNPNDFTNTAGWYKGKVREENFPGLELEVYPELTSENFANYDGHSYLKFSPEVSGQVLMNSGLNNNRTSVGSFTEGDKYIFSLEAYYDLPTMAIAEDYEIIISEYEFKDSVYSYIKKNSHYLFEKNESDGYYHCKYSISEKDYKTAKIGIFIKRSNTTPMYIKDMQLYPYKTLEGSEQAITPGENIEAIIKEQWCYYDKNATYTSEEDLKYLFKGDAPPKGNDGQLIYKPYYGDKNKPEEAYEKVRSITAKESNRFNLLQSLCELFENWVEFEIEHEPNGQISLDKSYRQKKWVSYRKYIGQDNHVGFKYGINLKSIKRTLDSNGAISKIIVKNNSNEFAPHGFCSISRAEENETGENAIYNFDYYVGQGLINFSTLNNDLYFQPNNPQGYLGYYRSLKVLNEEAQEKSEELAKLVVDISKYDSQYQTYKLSAEAAEEDKSDQESKFEELTGIAFSDAIPEFQTYNSSKHKPESWERYSLNGTEYKESESGNYARLKWWDNDEAKKIYQAIARDIVIVRDHKIIADNQKVLQDAAKLQQTTIEARLKEIREAKLEINKNFYKKYSRFIQEGSWISEDYIDDNLYYIDALSTLYTSSRPQVNYTIDVVELSQLEGYENFTFALGDKTYVEDKEFFGWAYDGSKRLYREEVIVSEITWEFDSPESNKIKVQNYKTQFEDLFQRVVATTQQVQFSTGEYKRSAAIVEPGGKINISTLQNSFINNALTLQNVKDQSVIIGDDGITTTNLSRPSEIVRVTSGGIFLSQNGGESWTAGITAGGINASCITTGQLNVSEVNLTMGSEVAFRWDKLGISAYRRDDTGISPGIFTRFDQFGIYGVNGNKDFDALRGEGAEPNTREQAMSKIKEAASFGLTWNGFWLRSNGTNGYVSISSDKDFEVIRIGQPTTKYPDGKIPIIQIGRLENNNSEYYGIKINDQDGATVFESNSSGELWLRTKMSVETSQGNSVSLGKLGSDNSYTAANKVIDANGKFKVYEDGHIEGTDAHFSGGSTFEGTIKATGGQIGGLTIEEWKNMGYSVRIESTAGPILKNQSSTTLTATLYEGVTPITESVEYQWYRNGAELLDETGQSITVPISMVDINSGVTYTCNISFASQEEVGA